MFEIFQNSFIQEEDRAIVWGYNAHMSKKASPGSYREKVFGEYIKEYYKEDSHSVGQFVGSGVIEHMKNQERIVKDLPNSI